jgi:hypothetical protein
MPRPTILALLASLMLGCSSEIRATGMELIVESLVARCPRLAECGAVTLDDVPRCVAVGLDTACSTAPEKCTTRYTVDAIEWSYCVDGYETQICSAAVASRLPTPCRPFAAVLGED